MVWNQNWFLSEKVYWQNEKEEKQQLNQWKSVWKWFEILRVHILADKFKCKNTNRKEKQKFKTNWCRKRLAKQN